MTAGADLPVMLPVETPEWVFGNLAAEGERAFPEPETELQIPAVVRQGEDHRTPARTSKLLQGQREVLERQVLENLKSNHRIKAVFGHDPVELSDIAYEVRTQRRIKVAGRHLHREPAAQIVAHQTGADANLQYLVCATASDALNLIPVANPAV